MQHFFKRLFVVFSGLSLSITFASASTEVVHHQLSVTLKPSSGYIHVIDTITLPENGNYQRFILNNKLSLKPATTATYSPDITSVKELPAKSARSFATKEYSFTGNPKKLRIEYSGNIISELSNKSEEFSLNMRDSMGIISLQGVYLTRASIWYPVFNDELVSFELDIKLPENWHSVSQGTRNNSNKNLDTWLETQPQDEIYLLASAYQVYSQKKNNIEALVFLNNKDDRLAKTYIETTFHYISMYNDLIGEYPYSKFAMVENFWETGFGMPSFTLLGPRVLRFPFILHTSYPHEILHNWWANGVLVDYEQGNWSEGLTSYLADHLLKEQRGQGHQYRRDVLQKYNDYVDESTDIALSQFFSRHNSALEAVGYGKTLMMFHMLRIKLGDKLFIQSLRNLYQQQLFKKTSYTDIKKVFEKTSSLDLSVFFEQWISRPGAPSLAIKDYSVEAINKPEISDQQNSRYTLNLTLLQQQKSAAYELDIPIALSVNNQTFAEQRILEMRNKEQTFNIHLAHKPLNFKIDSQFDVFRQLESTEIPPALSQGFGSAQVAIVLPNNSSSTLLSRYQGLATKWSQTQAGKWSVHLDSEINILPNNGAIWIVGWKNKYAKYFMPLVEKNVEWGQKNITIAGKPHDKNKHSMILSARNSNNQTILWLATTNSEAIPGLTRKLPHYRKYSYLAFTGDDPTNVTKGQWDTNASPLIRMLDAKSTFSKLIPRSDLTKSTD